MVLSRLAGVARTNVDKVDALLIAQLAGRQSDLAERNLSNEIGLERIGHIEDRANCLSAIRRIREFVLLVRDVEARALRTGPQSMRLSAHGKELPDHLAAAGSGGAIDDGDAARRHVCGPTIVHAGETDIHRLPASILDELHMIRTRILA